MHTSILHAVYLSTSNHQITDYVRTVGLKISELFQERTVVHHLSILYYFYHLLPLTSRRYGPSSVDFIMFKSPKRIGLHQGVHVYSRCGLIKKWRDVRHGMFITDWLVTRDEKRRKQFPFSNLIKNKEFSSVPLIY